MNVKLIHIAANPPYPNNDLPVLYYENALEEALLTESYKASEVLDLFEKNNYSNGWVNGIIDKHHYHSNSHEVLGCFAGEAMIQLGGPNGEILKFRKGDVILLPAGVSHKRLDQSQDFKIVGAYPDGMTHDMQYGDTEEYNKILTNIQQVPLPLTDPVTGSPSNVVKHWKD